MYRSLATAALALSLSASVLLYAPTGAQAQGETAGATEPLTLDVAAVEVIVAYVPPLKDPNVEHTLTLTPADATRLWALDHLKAGGSQGKATVIIRQASVVEEPLERTSGVRGWFTKDQSERYTARLEVEVRVDGAPGGFTGTTSASVARSTTVAEDVTLAEREKAMSALAQGVTADLAAQLLPAVRTTLFQVVRL